jgi:hypothetical protein
MGGVVRKIGGGVVGSSLDRMRTESAARANAPLAEQQARVNAQQADLERQQSDLAGRTAGSLRARRGRSSLLLGTDEQQSTLG